MIIVSGVPVDCGHGVRGDQQCVDPDAALLPAGPRRPPSPRPQAGRSAFRRRGHCCGGSLWAFHLAPR